MSQPYDLLTIGGGAAGFFGSITYAEHHPGMRIAILERGGEVLEKVSISGGGRCNVTNGITDPRELAKHYPRGGRELLGPFHKWHCVHTREWFEAHGVETHEEADGRVFPITNDSKTIVQCLTHTARELGIALRTHCRVTALIPPGEEGLWQVQVNEDETLLTRQVLFTTGSIPSSWKLLESIGHTLVPPVPSLFTFHIKDPRLQGLEGISVPWATVQGQGHTTEGPLLVTHWGLSGPAVLRLSAWAARSLAEVQYKFTLIVNWTDLTTQQVADLLQSCRSQYARQMPMSHPQAGLPARLWQRLCAAAGITEGIRWADLRKEQLIALQQQLTAATFTVTGKSTFKEEFVTAGGISLSEVDFRAFRSRVHPTLYLAGEVLDIDAVTGGFNFQAAWTGGHLAGAAMD